MKLIKYLMLTGIFLLAGMFSGCVKDDVDVPGGAGDIYEVEKDEYGLGFTISLDKLSADGGSTFNTDVEEYVDTEHLYVLFFNIDGIFLFSIDHPTAVPIGQTGSGNDRQWFIKIPVKEINPNLIEYIEENPFKIAVLANWTFNENNVPDAWDEFEFKQPVDGDGNLVYDEEGNLVGDHISLLAHCERDNVYVSSNQGYDHLVEYQGGNPHMGPYIEWVESYHRSEAIAEADLRNYYDVKTDKYTNTTLGIDYRNMWRVWNFGGTDNLSNKNYYNSPVESIRKAWAERNEESRQNFKMASDDSSLLYRAIDEWDDELYSHRYFESTTWDDAQKRTGLKLRMGSWDYFTESQNDSGEPFPPFFSYLHFNAKADGYLKIRYKRENGGKLKVHIDKHYDSSITNYLRYNSENRDEKSNKVVRPEEEPEGEELVFQAFGDIPNVPKEVFIYCVQEDDAVKPEVVEGEPYPYPSITIYEIEYIESRHLYDIDRRGILPTKDYPIPMYGIQDYEAIGKYWQPGVLFNLSTYNNAMAEGYNYRTVSLLRSLSKVEVMLPKASFKRKPSHVFLRSMNRSARITPVDFFTPTDLIWNGFNRTSRSDAQRLQTYVDNFNFAEQEIIEGCTGVKGEIEDIMQFGPIYIGANANSGQSTKEKLNEYHKTTAWPFGIWEQQWGWNWNRMGEDEERDDTNGYKVDYFDTYRIGMSRAHTGQTVPNYPKILHSRISRSDYARFHDITDKENDGYWHYVIYVPEKNITDADEPGNIADRPKIIHVEIRFNGGLGQNDEENIVDNMDDNGAYRLYFTEGGKAKNAGNFTFKDRSSWDDYEREVEVAKQHWPIIRNHVYRFKVNGGGSSVFDFYDNNVTFEVSAPNQRGAYWGFY